MLGPKHSLLVLLLGFVLTDSAISQVNIFVLGDTRSGHSIHETMVNIIAQENYDAVINTGDLVAVGSNDDHWNKFLQITKPLISSNTAAPTYLPVIGNHDLSSDKNPYKHWHQFLTWLPGNGEYYYQDFDNLRMIFLNSTSTNDVEQLDSLKCWLDSNRREWLIVTWHYPAFPFGSKRIDSESLNEWWPLLYEAKADIVINGHAHYYARSHPLKPLPENSSCVVDDEDGIIQVISGGSGAGLYSVRKDKYNETYYDFALAHNNDKQHHYGKISITDSTLTFEAIQIDGKVFDRFVLTKNRPVHLIPYRP